jgi:hypothetical protein
MSDWDPFLTETVTVEPYASQDEYGVASYGAAVSVAARVTGKVRRVSSFTGLERVSTVTVYLKDSPGVGPRDRLTLPSGWTPSQPEILSVTRCPDERGMIYETVYA